MLIGNCAVTCHSQPHIIPGLSQVSCFVQINYNFKSYKQAAVIKVNWLWWLHFNDINLKMKIFYFFIAVEGWPDCNAMQIPVRQSCLFRLEYSKIPPKTTATHFSIMLSCWEQSWKILVLIFRNIICRYRTGVFPCFLVTIENQLPGSDTWWKLINNMFQDR